MTNAATEQVYERLGPHLAEDPDGAAHLLADATAETFADSAAAIRDLPDGRGPFALLCDPQHTSASNLPWLGVHAGLRAAQRALPEADLRNAIALPEGHLRGTRSAILLAASRAVPTADRLIGLERTSFLTPDDSDLPDDSVIYARGAALDGALLDTTVNDREVKPTANRRIETYTVTAKGIVEHELDRATVGALEDAYPTIADLEDDQT